MRWHVRCIASGAGRVLRKPEEDLGANTLLQCLLAKLTLTQYID
jgi:hypothetical protein